MADRYLLDTGAANLAALKSPNVIARIEAASIVFLPTVVIGELYYGAYWHAHLHQSTRYLDLYDAFIRGFRGRTLAGTAETGQIFGAIRAELRAQGALIQHADMWVAALARQYGLTVATMDADFARISALTHEIWP